MTVFEFPKIAFTLFLITIVCQYPKCISNNASVSNISSTSPPKTKIEQSLKYVIPKPEDICVSKCHLLQPLVNLNDNDRELVKYYKFLTDIKKLELNLPTEMPGGKNLFKSEDVICFSSKNSKAYVYVIRYSNLGKQTLGFNVVNKFNVDNRKALQVGNYILLIKWGDERFNKILESSLKHFES